ncbi:MAG: hypothetical protein ACYDDH_12030 [Candidatus Desulforudaceae bacterium]
METVILAPETILAVTEIAASVVGNQSYLVGVLLGGLIGVAFWICAKEL